MKLRHKIFLKEGINTIFQIICIISFGIYNGCLYEILSIYFSFFIFRKSFEKQYHAHTVWGCTVITVIVFFIISNIVMSKNISVAFTILFSYFINYVSSSYRDYLDLKDLKRTLDESKKKSKLSKRQKVLNILKGNVDEDSIYNYCVRLGIPKYAETIYLFLNNTLEETSNILGIDYSTTVRRIDNFILKNNSSV